MGLGPSSVRGTCLPACLLRSAVKWFLGALSKLLLQSTRSHGTRVLHLTQLEQGREGRRESKETRYLLGALAAMTLACGLEDPRELASARENRAKSNRHGRDSHGAFQGLCSRLFLMLNRSPCVGFMRHQYMLFLFLNKALPFFLLCLMYQLLDS